MGFRIFVFHCLLLFLCLSPLLAAEDFALSFKKAELEPRFFQGFNILDVDEVKWQNHEEFLTDRAVSFQAPLVYTVEVHTKLYYLSYDFSVKEGKNPDILYVDINENKTIDKNEGFSLKGMESSEYMSDLPSPILYAEKVPLILKGGDLFYANIYLLLTPPEEGKEGVNILLGSSAWGGYEGLVTLDGKTFRAVLKDYNHNGRCDDFQRDDRFGPCDYFCLIPEEKESTDASTASLLPLRQKAVILGRAFSIDIKDKGETLVLDPLEVDFGRVLFPSDNLKIVLSNSEWGRQNVRGGEAHALPAGTWAITFFSLISKKENHIELAYSGPPDLEVEIGSNKDTVFDLATELEGSVTAQKSEDGFRLSLNLLTTQGSKFRGYRNRKKPIEGIPFKILDEAEKTVHDAIFSFG